VFVSSLDYARNASIGRYGLGNLEEFPYAVDTERYLPGETTGDELKRLGIDPARAVILFVGAMDRGHAFKGVPELITAAATAGVADKAQLVLVGDGELRPGFEQLATSTLGAAAARFVGRVSEDDLRLLYRSATVTDLPSTTGEEAFGIVLIESLASGTPVIASALPGVRTIVNEASGWLVPPGDVAALARRLSEIVDDPVRARAMRQSARALAVERFSHRRESEQLAQTFGAIAASAAQGSRQPARRRDR
jgi:glycosyltransferase involved in cell wall biosynthesis